MSRVLLTGIVLLGLFAAEAAKVDSAQANKADDDKLELSGAFPASVKTIGAVMPASIFAEKRFERVVAALEKAGYRVKRAPRLNFTKVAPVEDRVKDFEEMWMDPEVDIVVCARGGTGAEDLLPKLDWARLRTRKQRVLGFSNITMLLNGMLKEGAGIPISGSTFSHMLYCDSASLDWLNRTVAATERPEVKLVPLRAGAVKGLPCGGHVSLVERGARMGYAADTRGRIVFLECVHRTPENVFESLDYLVKSGYFAGAAAVVFGDITPAGPNRQKLTAAERAEAKAKIAKLEREFTEKVKCPVFTGYPYGHVSRSFAIDFTRELAIDEKGTMR